MNTFQIAQVLTKDPFTKGSFSGVYACDELISIEINKYPKSFVVNTDPIELPGTHWIAIYFNEQMKGEFFDSYGNHPFHYNKHFLDFMHQSIPSANIPPPPGNPRGFAPIFSPGPGDLYHLNCPKVARVSDLLSKYQVVS